jgi:hypothetical protein
MLIYTVYKQPNIVKEFTLENWNKLISQCYTHHFLARMFYIFDDLALVDNIPSSLLWHFTSAKQYYLAHIKDIDIEIAHIEQAFKMAGERPIFLKGTAYHIQGRVAAKGRIFSDVDVFINKSKLEKVERILNWHGWKTGEIDKYDDQYYRRWMHEIPPLTHQTRGSTLDLHHNLLPLTSKYKLDAQMLERGVTPGDNVLSAQDLVIHCIVHLFMESEFEKGFRDITDIDLLIRQYSQEINDFPKLLMARAKQLGMELLVYYAMNTLTRFLATPIGAVDLTDVAPYRLKDKIMSYLFSKVLFYPKSVDASLSNKFAHFAMYIRGHWLRMPIHLLAPHLIRKGVYAIFAHGNNESVIKDKIG